MEQKTSNMSTSIGKIATGRLVVDLEAISKNYHYLSAQAPSAETGAAVKGDAYGVGLEPVARALLKCGCRSFFVAVPDEGVQLRAIAPSADIYVLSGVFPETVATLQRNNLLPVLNTSENVALWTGSAVSDLPFALHIDTGMNRLGLSLAEASSFTNLKPKLVMSHFACADAPGEPLNQQQLAAFSEVRKLFPGVTASMANSAAILNGSDCHFDLTRPGIALYGGGSIVGQPSPMCPVVHLEGRILQIRSVSRGDIYGYGAAHKFESTARLAIVGLGYADGYMRAASGSGVPLREVSDAGYGMIDAHKVPVIGRISMDLTAFDITALPANSVQQGDWITLLNDEITVDHLAEWAGTIGLEILTALGKRFARSYING